MVDPLLLLFKKHNTWKSIVINFGCNKDTAEDLVQEMYIKIKRKVDEGSDIMFSENEINYYYIFKTLNTLFLDLKKKEKKVRFENIDDFKVEEDVIVNYDKYYFALQEELNNLHWYNKKVYELIEGGESISSLSRKTNISYYSLYNTYRKVKQELKNKLKL